MEVKETFRTGVRLLMLALWLVASPHLAHGESGGSNGGKGVAAAVSRRDDVRSSSAESLPNALDRRDLEDSGRAGTRWRAGVHYSVLTPSYRKTPLTKGKVEVREFFMYTSPTSRDTQPYLQDWLRKKPRYVEFVRSPAIVFSHARLQARMYFVLKELGHEALQVEFFSWVHDPKHYETYFKHYDSYDTIPIDDQIAHFALNLRFARANGIDEDQFLAAYTSKDVDDAVFEAQFQTNFNHVVNTSTFVIDGKYSTSVGRIAVATDSGKIGAEAFQQMFELIEYLASVEIRERAVNEQ